MKSQHSIGVMGKKRLSYASVNHVVSSDYQIEVTPEKETLQDAK